MSIAGIVVFSLVIGLFIYNKQKSQPIKLFHKEHDWIEATCTDPRTCSVCDETEGSALEHT